ncbi:MAG: sensor histidine kinase [Saprospiraceae bacterium]
MLFKVTRSDVIVFLFYALFTIILYYVGSEGDELKYVYIECARFIILNALSAYVIVYVIFARFIPKKQYFLLFLVLVPFLYLMGIIWINYECYFFSNCKESPWAFSYIQYGFVNHLEEAGMLATIMLGKKMFDMQLHFANMEKEKRTAELSFLKAQIDPHFLFNNLNTIDALIDKDPQAAKAYLHKLAKLYRYLVSSKDQEVVPLEEELAFAKNYIYLIEERFGKAYEFDIQNQHPNSDELWVPPGALQTLLENIVKHNQGNHTDPVKTNILIDQSGITVANDLRPKKGIVDSTGFGLKNLKARYALLTDEKVKINSGDLFTVELPSIKVVQ